MSPTSTPTGPGLPGVTHLVSQPIISKGNTICPKCRKATKARWTKAPAEVRDLLGPDSYRRNGAVTEELPEQIRLRYVCEHCGHAQNSVVFSDSRFFFDSSPGEAASMSCGVDCACRASDGAIGSPLGKNALGTSPRSSSVFDHFDNLSPCVVLVEIVRECNWSCSTCFPDSVKTANPKECVPLETFKTRLQELIDRRGDIEILQLSGGEPTLHPHFFEILDWAQKNPRIHVVMINTNGSKLLVRSFGDKLIEMVDRTKVHLYLKFNGPTKEAQLVLARFNAHPSELRLLDFVQHSQIATTLAMTVVPENLRDVWGVVELGLSVQSVRGVNYQPRFGAGRIDAPITQLVDAGHVINHLIHQASPVLTENSIWPLPCGNPNCQFIGMLHRESRKCFGSAVTEEQRVKLLGFLADKINYTGQDLTKCGCEVTKFGQLVGQLEATGQMFRLSIKPFMTFGGAGHNWSCSRTDQCCTSVLGQDGKLRSFCRAYNGLDEGRVTW